MNYGIHTHTHSHLPFSMRRKRKYVVVVAFPCGWFKTIHRFTLICCAESFPLSHHKHNGKQIWMSNKRISFYVLHIKKRDTWIHHRNEKKIQS